MTTQCFPTLQLCIEHDKKMGCMCPVKSSSDAIRAPSKTTTSYRLENYYGCITSYSAAATRTSTHEVHDDKEQHEVAHDKVCEGALAWPAFEIRGRHLEP